MEEKILMKLEVIRGEALSTLNQLFRFKVQLEEQLEENEVKIHYNRGIMDGLERVQTEITEIAKGERLSKLKTGQATRPQSTSNESVLKLKEVRVPKIGDDGSEEAKEPSIGAEEERKKI